MSIVHALVITVNLLLAVVVYVIAAQRRRVEAVTFALGGSFLALALADLALAIDGPVDGDRIATIVALDVLLVVAGVSILAHERGRRRRAQQEHEAVLIDLDAERRARELALHDRLSGRF